MDNLSAHKVQGIETTIQETGAKLLFLPPYSPDLSPIEHCWSKIKTLPRGVEARTRDVLNRALKEIIDTVSVKDAEGWFDDCGYPLR